MEVNSEPSCYLLISVESCKGAVPFGHCKQANISIILKTGVYVCVFKVVSENLTVLRILLQV